MNKQKVAQNPFKTVMRLLKDMRSFRFQIIIILLASVGYVVANIFAALHMKKILEEIFSQARLGVFNPKAIATIVWILVAIFSCSVLLRFIMTRLILNVSVGTMFNMRVKMYNHMLKLPVKYFDSNLTGDIMSRYTNDIATLRNMISNAFPELIMSTFNVVGALIAMLIISPILSISSFVMLAIMITVITIMSKRGRKHFKKQQIEVGNVNAYAEEYIKGQKVVRTFCREEETSKEFSSINERYQKAAFNAEVMTVSLYPLMGNLSYLTYAVTAITAAVLIARGLLGDFADATSTLITFLQLSSQLSMPILNASNQLNSVLVGLAGAERIYSVVDEEVEVDEGNVSLVNVEIDKNGEMHEVEQHTNAWAWKLPNEDGSYNLIRLRGDVRFYGVRFCYVENQPVLNRVDLYAKAEQKIAFVGSTGAGKTTITNLINRFYEIPFGTIKYDGIDIKDIKKKDLRHSLAIVLQDTHLFEGTIMENIKYGKLDATDEEVYEAAKLANADGFIKELSDGYQTKISGSSDSLSQGQRQMISIARAAIADAPVIILDEATSSIDTRTEKLIQDSMDKLMHGRTTFAIAHRLSTIKDADAILVLENGEIIERGTHDDLLKLKGRYYRLYTGREELS